MTHWKVGSVKLIKILIHLNSVFQAPSLEKDEVSSNSKKRRIKESKNEDEESCPLLETKNQELTPLEKSLKRQCRFIIQFFR